MQFHHHVLVADNIKQVFCGCNFTYLVTFENAILAAGINDSCQLNQSASHRSLKAWTKVELEHAAPIKFVACGFAHVIIVTEDNQVFGCGFCKDGALGFVSSYAYTFMRKLPINIGTITTIACGPYASYFVSDATELYVCGTNAKQVWS